MRFVASIALLVGFFTRIPVPSGLFHDEVRLKQVLWGIPMVGALIGALLALLMIGLSVLGLSNSIIVILVLGLSMLLTGALHEDGWADFFDGLGVSDSKRALEVMRDSQIGSFGCLALIFSFAFRGVLLFELLQRGVGPMAVFLMHVGGRGMILPFMMLPLARSDGMAHQALSFKDDSSLLSSTWFGLFVGWVFMAGCFVALMSLGQAFLVLGVIFLGAGLFAAFVIRRYGGVTGDIYGAAEQLTEKLVLFGLFICSFT